MLLQQFVQVRLAILRFDESSNDRVIGVGVRVHRCCTYIMTKQHSQSVALVTGGNRGIGRAVVAGLAARGVAVVLGSRDRRRGAQAAAELRSCTNEIDTIELDVTDPSSIAADVHSLALGKFDDLLQLRKVIDALQRRHVESAPHVESSYAAEPLSRPSRSAVKPYSVKPYSVEPVVDRLGSARRRRPDRCAQAAGTPHRADDGKRADKGGRS